MPRDEWRDGETLDEQMIAAWYRLKPERQRKQTLTLALSWLRRYPSVYHAITSTDTDAASIAVRYGWASQLTGADIEADWQSLTAEDVTAKVRAIKQSNPAFGSWLATALARYAPQHLPLLPSTWLPAARNPGA